MPPWIYFFVLGEFRLPSRKRPIRRKFFSFGFIVSKDGRSHLTGVVLYNILIISDGKD